MTKICLKPGKLTKNSQQEVNKIQNVNVVQLKH